MLLAHRPCRRNLFTLPPKRAPVHAPGAWFRDVAFLTGAIPDQFSIPANDGPHGLPSLSVVPNSPCGFFPSNRRRCPSLYHMCAKAIYPCRSTIWLRTAGAAPGQRSRAVFPAAFRHAVAETAPALRGNIAPVRMTGKILGPAKALLAVCSAARLRRPGLMRSSSVPCHERCHGCHNDAELAPCPAANPASASCAPTSAAPIPGCRFRPCRNPALTPCQRASSKRHHTGTALPSRHAGMKATIWYCMIMWA